MADQINTHAAGGGTRGSLPLVPPRLWRFVVWGVLGAALLVFDQVVKEAVREAALAGVFPITVVPGVIDFTFVMNRGAAFGIGQGFGLVSVGIAVAVVGFSVWYLARAEKISKLEVVGLGLVLGGAVGNAVDRVLHGFVTDFIATTFIDFPVFNIADIGIVVGVALAFVGFAFFSPAADGGGDARGEQG